MTVTLTQQPTKPDVWRSLALSDAEFGQIVELLGREPTLQTWLHPRLTLRRQQSHHQSHIHTLRLNRKSAPPAQLQYPFLPHHLHLRL